MKYLLDTNAVSEWVKPRPDPGLAEWLAACDEESIYLSVVTLAELRRGIARLELGRRRSQLDVWLRDELPQRFDGRILPVTAAVADVWGELVAEREALGRPISAMDAFIAATTRLHEMILVTRNEADFQFSLKALLNPWLK